MSSNPTHALALISLSRGGSDASVFREFDMRTRSFVKGGFEIPEAKSRVAWEDHDTLLVGTDFGPGSLTESGYPRIVKRWHRGQPWPRPRRCSPVRPPTFWSARGRPDAGLRTHLDLPGDRLLQR